MKTEWVKWVNQRVTFRFERKEAGEVVIPLFILFDLYLFLSLSTIMFFGQVVTKSNPFKVNVSPDQVLCLTNVSLASGSGDNDALEIKNQDGKSFLITHLNQTKSSQPINVFLSANDQVTLINKGSGILHVTGFTEESPKAIKD